jgi:hypothetical protein
MSTRYILLDHAHIGDQHIPSSHQTLVLWHDSRITSKITNKSMRRECSVRFMQSTTHAFHDAEAVELSVLVVGISHWSKSLIQSEDSILWKSEPSTSQHKYDVRFWKQSVGTRLLGVFWLQYNFILVSNCEDPSTKPRQKDYLYLVRTCEEKCTVQLEYNNQMESMTIKGIFNILPLFRRCLKELI